MGAEINLSHNPELLVPQEVKGVTAKKAFECTDTYVISTLHSGNPENIIVQMRIFEHGGL
jgi:hypothetical protein